ncbi:MAG TPA: hypothetical protein EYO62_05855 [Aquificales bacterium]|nr:hypothetical protein [Aquificales bacterium]
MTLKELLNGCSDEVIVFYLGKGWQVHIWQNGDVYIQGLKYENDKHWTTFKKIKVNLQMEKEEFLRRMDEIIRTQTFEWEEL